MLRDILNHSDLVTVEPDAKVIEVAKLMERENVGCVLVLSEGKPRGLITDRDIVVRCIAKNVDVSDCTVEQVMTESVETAKDTDGVFDCIRKMRDAGVRRMPVVDDEGKAVGIITAGDLLAMLSKEFATLAQGTTPLEEQQGEDVEKVRKMAA